MATRYLAKWMIACTLLVSAPVGACPPGEHSAVNGGVAGKTMADGRRFFPIVPANHINRRIVSTTPAVSAKQSAKPPALVPATTGQEDKGATHSELLLSVFPETEKK